MAVRLSPLLQHVALRCGLHDTTRKLRTRSDTGPILYGNGTFTNGKAAHKRRFIFFLVASGLAVLTFTYVGCQTCIGTRHEKPNSDPPPPYSLFDGTKPRSNPSTKSLDKDRSIRRIGDYRRSTFPQKQTGPCLSRSARQASS